MANHGGRVLCFQNQFNDKIYPGEKLISLDGNSLYPSAMLQNFPIGRFKELNEK